MVMNYYSPLRYPGGKAGLAFFLEQVIEFNGLHGCVYYEPFVGGGGAALKLLSNGIVSHVSLNDADPRIYAFWHAALNETSRFINRIFEVPLSLNEWHTQRDICYAPPSSNNIFEQGFSAFYMNRCNRSGILKGAGPIGGRAQKSKWGLDARFSREGLAERIHWLGKMRNHISIQNEDGLQFLKNNLPRGRGRNRVFTYLDPPYVGKGGHLYLNHFLQKDHTILAKYMNSQNTLKWVMSYDDHELIHRLYQDNCRIFPFSLQYSLQNRRRGAELLIAPQTTSLPGSIRCRGNEEPLMETITS